MRSSNLTSSLLGLLATLVMGLVWVWFQDFSQKINLGATWAVMVYASCAGFVIWLRGLRYARLINDIPTSQIATAPQGYVELYGKAIQFEDQKAKSLVESPMLWYRKTTAVRNDSSSRHAFPFNLFHTTIHIEESETPFGVDDGTGDACILPFGAEIIATRKNVRYGDNCRITEESILPGDPLYLIGNFSSHQPVFAFEEALRKLVRLWESDPAKRRLYDKDRDGKLSIKEWAAMHEAARTAIAQQELELTSGQKHLVHMPDDGRPFLLSTQEPEKLAGHYLFHLAIGLVLFFGAGGMAVWMMLGGVWH